jgi:hypothetical protein
MIRQLAPADGGLKVEPDERDDLRDGLTVCDQRIVVSLGHRAETQQAGVILQVAEDAGLLRRLLGLTRDAADADERNAAVSVGAVHLFGRKLKHRFV